MYKRLLLFIIFILSLFFGWYALSYKALLDNINVEKDLISYRKSYNIFLTAKDVSLKKGITPYIKINFLKINNHEISDVKIKFSLISMLRFKYEFSDIKFDSGLIKGNKNISYFDIITIYQKLISLKLARKISFNNLRISSKDEILLDEGAISSNGKIFIKIKNLNIIGSALYKENGLMVDLKTSHPDYFSVIKANYNDSNHKFNLETNITINDLHNFVNSYFNNNDFDLTRIRKNQLASLKFEITGSKSDYMLKNLTLNGDNILMQASLAKDESQSSLLKINISKLDLNKFLDKNNNSNQQLIKENFKIFSSNYNIKVKIDSLKFFKEELTNLNILGFTDNGTLKIEKCSGLLSSGGSFNLHGFIVENNYRLLLDGKINFIHKDFNKFLLSINQDSLAKNHISPINYNSNLSFSRKDFSLNNYIVKIDEKIYFGDFSYKNISDTPRINIKLKTKNLNLDDNSTPILSEYIKSLTSILQGLQERDYTKKLVPLRQIDNKINFSLEADRVIFSGINFDDFKIRAYVKKAFIKSQEVSFNHLDEKISFNFSLNAWGLKPEINFELSNGNFYLTNEQISSFLQSTNNLNLSNISLKFKGKLNKLISDKLGEISDVRFSLFNNSNFIILETFTGRYFGGAFSLTSNIKIKPFVIEGVFALNNFTLNDMVKKLSDNIFQVKGAGSVNGKFRTAGISRLHLLSNLELESSFLGDEIEIENFGIDNYIAKIISPDYDYKNKIDYDSKIAAYEGTTNINKMSGDLSISGKLLKISKVQFFTLNTGASLAGSLSLVNGDSKMLAIFSFLPPAKENSKVENKHIEIPMKIEGFIGSTNRTIDYKNLNNLLPIRSN